MDTVPTGLESRLAAAGCRHPAQAVKTLEQLGGDATSRGHLGAVLPTLVAALRRVPDPDLALNNLDRFAQAVLDRRFLFGLFRDHPPVLHLALTILGSSEFLSDLLIRQPQLFEWLLEPGTIRRPKPRRDLFEEAAQAVRPRQSVERQWAALRRFKAQEILRIGLQDLLGRQSLTGITEELSNLAEAVLETAVRICRRELSARHGAPQTEEADGRIRECGFVVMGLGKLGGGELNFSSDIDPIFIYEKDGETAGIPAEEGRTGVLSNQEYFRKLGEMLSKSLADPAPDGHLYRVDLRLRPEGRTGAIAASLRACEVYYESWGRTWERQALIKARPVAGDLWLGETFLRMISPFVYRQSLDFSALDEIRAMKTRINVTLAQARGERRNVKLGYGGIREIEFLIQGLQLVYGGRNPWVRESNSLRALHRLAGQRLIGDVDHEVLAEAYTFLRTLEHRLQILHDRQTHTIPADPKELATLARRMGYHPFEGGDPAEALLADYDRHTREVRRLYDAFLGSLRPPEDSEAEEAPADPVSLFFTADLAPEQLRERLAAVGFADLDRALRNLGLLRDGQASASHSSGTRRALARLAPALLEAVAAVPDPDLALSTFERFVVTLGARATYLTLLEESPELLRRLVVLFGTSEFLAGTLLRYPELTDALLTPASTAAGGREAIQADLARGLEAAETASARLDALRRVKKAEELRIGLQDILGQRDGAETYAALSRLAEACLAVALEQATRDLAERFGLPDPAGVCVVGMGKLGGGELGYASDLDLLLVYGRDGQTGGPERISHVEYFSRLADRLGKLLTTITQEGAAYRVDMRLRPGGQKGGMAQSLESYERHFTRLADPWERQAYIKARPVAGDPATASEFLRVVHRFVYEGPPLPDLAAQMHAMRQRMEVERAVPGAKGAHVKLGSGGIVDIEFLVQYLQLCHGRSIAALRTPNTLEALRVAAAAGLLPAADAEAIAAAYGFLRRVENRLRIVADLSVNTLPSAPAKLETLARRMGYAAAGGAAARERFLSDFAATTGRVRELYLRIL
ncbi:MAG: bifunctional [glutamate--ammonia ligase]-adenylyl-L-tyrosine phosphorylase/[glutamate--ammonia-ligase] adenylyltransferase, partial [Candidatus Methylomirabilota bacterium]